MALGSRNFGSEARDFHGQGRRIISIAIILVLVMMKRRSFLAHLTAATAVATSAGGLIAVNVAALVTIHVVKVLLLLFKCFQLTEQGR
jgi:hypothetical protein